MNDPFASGPIATVLAWLFAASTLIAGAAGLLNLLVSKDDLPRAFKVWMVFCLAFLSPARYMFFLVVAAAVYPVQSWSAFFSFFPLILYVPIVFGLLYALGVGLPVLAAVVTFGRGEQQGASRYLAASVVLPIACVIGSFLFHLALPAAAWTLRWLPAENIIKATNGPAAFVFDYVAAPLSPMVLPEYFEMTPRDAVAQRRCHAAALYLSSREEARFVRTAYPAVYEALKSRRER